MGAHRRQEQGDRPRAAPPPPRHLPARRGSAAPVRRLRTGRGQTVRAHQAAQEPGEVPGVLRYLRSLCPPDVRIAIICDNFSPHLTTRKDKRVGAWAAANNAEIAYTPTNCSWLNRIEAQFTALRYFALDGTDHATTKNRPA
jgi:hypothetical protein